MTGVATLEYKSKTCNGEWIELDFDCLGVKLTIEENRRPPFINCDGNTEFEIRSAQNRLWLQTPYGPEFEIDDIRIPGRKSYRELEEEDLNLCN